MRNKRIRSGNILANTMLDDGATVVCPNFGGGHKDLGDNHIAGSMYGGVQSGSSLSGYPYDSSVSLDGVTMHAQISDPDDHMVVSNTCSLFFLMKMRPTSKDPQDLIEFGNTTDGLRLDMDNSNVPGTREINARVEVGGAQIITRTAIGVIEENKVHSIALVRSTGPDALTIYLDGTSSVVAGAGAAVNGSNADEMFIGVRKQLTGRSYFDGEISNIAFFTGVALSQGQIDNYIRILNSQGYQ